MSASVLTRLDGYMAAAGYDTDHPWRSEISAALAVPVSTAHDTDTVRAAAADIDIASGTIVDLLKLAEGQFDRDGDICRARSALRAVGRYVDDIMEFTAVIENAVGPMDGGFPAPISERWVPVAPASMPPDEVVVIGWDSTTEKPCAVFFDFNPGVHSWISQFDPTTIYEGEITHWRYCNAPSDARSEGVTS